MSKRTCQKIMREVQKSCLCQTSCASHGDYVKVEWQRSGLGHKGHVQVKQVMSTSQWKGLTQSQSQILRHISHIQVTSVMSKSNKSCPRHSGRVWLKVKVRFWGTSAISKSHRSCPSHVAQDSRLSIDLRVDMSKCPWTEVQVWVIKVMSKLSGSNVSLIQTIKVMSKSQKSLCSGHHGQLPQYSVGYRWAGCFTCILLL